MRTPWLEWYYTANIYTADSLNSKRKVAIVSKNGLTLIFDYWRLPEPDQNTDWKIAFQCFSLKTRPEIAHTTHWIWWWEKKKPSTWNIALKTQFDLWITKWAMRSEDANRHRDAIRMCWCVVVSLNCSKNGDAILLVRLLFNGHRFFFWVDQTKLNPNGDMAIHLMDFK